MNITYNTIILKIRYAWTFYPGMEHVHCVFEHVRSLFFPNVQFSETNLLSRKMGAKSIIPINLKKKRGVPNFFRSSFQIRTKVVIWVKYCGLFRGFSCFYILFRVVNKVPSDEWCVMLRVVMVIVIAVVITIIWLWTIWGTFKRIEDKFEGYQNTRRWISYNLTKYCFDCTHVLYCIGHRDSFFDVTLVYCTRNIGVWGFSNARNTKNYENKCANYK